MSADPFPLPRVQELLGRFPAYGRLVWRLTREPLLSRARRMAIAGAAAYVVSPVDLVPGIIPLVGQLDDVAVALLAIRFALAGLDTEHRRAVLADAGLAEEHLTRDLATVGATGAWLVRSGARVTTTSLRLAAKGGWSVLDRTVRLGRDVTTGGVPRR